MAIEMMRVRPTLVEFYVSNDFVVNNFACVEDTPRSLNGRKLAMARCFRLV